MAATRTTNNIDKIQILLLGDSGAGKSSLVLQFAEHTFEEKFEPTIGIDFKLRTVELNGRTVKVQIWDTAGQERFRTITHSYFNKADGIALVYDVTSEKSFNSIVRWMEDIRSHTENVDVLLLGNKSDLQERRVITAEQGQRAAEQFQLAFYEVSAKTAHNVETAFLALAKKTHERVVMSKLKSNSSSSNTVTLTTDSKGDKKKCCK